jgi:hypothetical protein
VIESLFNGKKISNKNMLKELQESLKMKNFIG